MSDINIQDLAMKVELGDGCSIRDALSNVTSDPVNMSAVKVQAAILEKVAAQSKIDAKKDPSVHEITFVKKHGGTLEHRVELEVLRSDGGYATPLYDEVYDSQAYTQTINCSAPKGDAK